jgi:hypothetical protein
MSETGTDFEKAAKEMESGKDVGIVRELLQFLAENKKWWLIPMLLVLLVMGGLILLSGTAAAPFIYTLF